MARTVRHGALLALTVALSWVSAPRAAEPEPPVVTEEEVVVPLPRARANGDPAAAATVIDATRFRGEAKTVADLVTAAPGVAVNRYGGLGQLATVSIRGSNADQVRVLVDGLPFNTGAGGGVDLSRIPPSWIGRLEIVRGAEGALYGPGAAAGVLNVVTRHDEGSSWSAQATAGSFRTFGAAVDGSLGGRRWGLFGALSFDDTSGRFPYEHRPLQAVPGSPSTAESRENNASRSGGLLAKGWAGVGDGRIDAILQLSAGRRGFPGTAYHLTPGDGQHDFLAGLVTRITYSLARGVHLLAGARAREDRLSVSAAPFPTVRQRDYAGGGDVGLLWLSGPSALTLRAEAGFERLDVKDGGGHERTELSLAVSEDLSLLDGRLHLLPAGRWDFLSPFSGLSGKLGGTLRLVGPLSVRASAGRAFRVPSFAELHLTQGLILPNPDLVPERSWSFDAGIVADGRFGVVSGGGFTHLYQELVVYEPSFSQRYKPFNAGKAIARGVEIEAASAPLGRARLSGSVAYTLLVTETRRGEEAILGKSLPHRSRHRLFARVAVAPAPFEAHVEVHYLSSQHLDLRNSPSQLVPSTFTINTGAAIPIARHPRVRLHAELRNVLDDRSLQDGYGNPLPGRMVLVTLRVTGDKEIVTP